MGDSQLKNNNLLQHFICQICYHYITVFSVHYNKNDKYSFKFQDKIFFHNFLNTNTYAAILMEQT